MNKTGERKIWFVSRHPGAWAWFSASGNRDRWQVTHRVPHLDSGAVSEEDIVIGTLPVQLAAEICAIGAEYWHINLSLNETMRGMELSYDEMVATSASLEQYSIRRLPP